MGSGFHCIPRSVHPEKYIFSKLFFFFKKDTYPSHEPRPSSLDPSQRPLLLTPSCWGLVLQAHICNESSQMSICFCSAVSQTIHSMTVRTENMPRITGLGSVEAVCKLCTCTCGRDKHTKMQPFSHPYPRFSNLSSPHRGVSWCSLSPLSSFSHSLQLCLRS